MADLDGMPYVKIGNNELGEPVGDTAPCPHCGVEYPVRQSEPPMLQFVQCGDTAYLVGVDGKSWKPSNG